MKSGNEVYAGNGKFDDGMGQDTTFYKHTYVSPPRNWETCTCIFYYIPNELSDRQTEACKTNSLLLAR